jgi:hypothetical protein
MIANPKRSLTWPPERVLALLSVEEVAAFTGIAGQMRPPKPEKLRKPAQTTFQQQLPRFSEVGIRTLEARVGIEPTNKGFADLGITGTLGCVFMSLDGVDMDLGQIWVKCIP